MSGFPKNGFIPDLLEPALKFGITITQQQQQQQLLLLLWLLLPQLKQSRPKSPMDPKRVVSDCCLQANCTAILLPLLYSVLRSCRKLHSDSLPACTLTYTCTMQTKSNKRIPTKRRNKQYTEIENINMTYSFITDGCVSSSPPMIMMPLSLTLPVNL